MSETADPPAARRRGLALGVLAMALFGLTLPMTRLATGDAAAPQLSPWFVTAGRAVLAAVLAAAFLLATRSPWPRRGDWPALAAAAAGNAVAYPLALALALRHVSAGHAAVLTALLPLATAAAAAWLLHQRESRGFWGWALASCALVVGFSAWRLASRGEAFAPAWADVLLAAGVLGASIGYVYGAQATQRLGAERVICWVVLLTLPLALPAALASWPRQPVAAASWAAFGYLGAVSMWAAFFAWYRALAIGGAVRVSQVQVLQPFFAIAFSLPLLGEAVDAGTLAFAAAVVASVWAGQRSRRPELRPRSRSR